MWALGGIHCIIQLLSGSLASVCPCSACPLTNNGRGRGHQPLGSLLLTPKHAGRPIRCTLYFPQRGGAHMTLEMPCAHYMTMFNPPASWSQSTEPTRVTVSGTVNSLSLAVSMISDICKGTFKGFALLRQMTQQNRSITPYAPPQPRPVYAPGYGLIPPSQVSRSRVLGACSRAGQCRPLVWGSACHVD